MQPEERVVNKYLDSKNIADNLDKELLDEIGAKCSRGFEIDFESESEYRKNLKEIKKMAMQTFEVKNFPFERAANIKYPLLSTAAIQFSSRALSSIINGADVVHGKPIGKDDTGEKADRAKRIGDHMSYQCSYEMTEWVPDMDKLLVLLPYSGDCYKRTYFDSSEGRNVSEFVSPEQICFHYKTKNFKKCPRITYSYELYPNEIQERINSGFFRDIELGVAGRMDDDDYDPSDEDTPHTFLEQYCWYDLDDDDYKEPYTVTVHKKTKQVVRIKARYDLDGIELASDGKIKRIDDIKYITQFIFMPSPDESARGFGFGRLLGPLNETVNTVTNQLLDTGTLSNAQPGLIGKGINLGRGRGGGVLKFKPGEWKSVMFSGDDLRKNIFPLPVREPSTVLFQLLGFMVDAGERVASVSEILTGEQSIHNEPATTTLARIEQGLKLFSNIYLRIYRSLCEEFQKLYRLNRVYLDPEVYFTVLDDKKAVKREDYDGKDIDVIPVANPNEVSDTQKMVRAEILMGLKGQGLNDDEINRRFLKEVHIEEPDKLLPKEGAKPPIDPKITLELQKLELERDKFEFDVMKFKYEMGEIQSKIIKNLADAESKELGPQLEQYKKDMDVLISREKNANNQGSVSGVEKQSGNTGSVSNPQ